MFCFNLQQRQCLAVFLEIHQTGCSSINTKKPICFTLHFCHWFTRGRSKIHWFHPFRLGTYQWIFGPRVRWRTTEEKHESEVLESTATTVTNCLWPISFVECVIYIYVAPLGLFKTNHPHKNFEDYLTNITSITSYSNKTNYISSLTVKPLGKSTEFSFFGGFSLL